MSSQGVELSPAKVEAIQKMEPPQTVGELRTFLGTGYLRQFIPQYSQIAAPMTELLEEKRLPEKGQQKRVDWGAAQKTSFDAFKQSLLTPPVLLFPDWSMASRFSTDASIVGAGIVLSQVKEDGLEHVIAYASRRCSITNRKRAATELECMAMLWVINHSANMCGVGGSHW
ncbi:unnamed protein product [Discosporangium mesarthrocarpum]